VARLFFFSYSTQNSLQDLYSLLKFLRAEPWSELRWWKHAIADPHAKGDPRALSTLHTLLRPLLLRRTKNMRDVDGVRIGDLAPATVSR
jgi:DNA repair protein RAD5